MSAPDLSRLADELRQLTLSKHATEAERALLAAASDPGAIVLRTSFMGDLVVRSAGAEPIEAGEIGNPSDERALAILRRVELRSELNLPARPCGSRRPRPGCDCLEKTLDVLGAGEPSKRDVTDAATELHKANLAETKRLERERKQRLAANMRAAARTKLAQAPAAILEALPEPSLTRAESEKPKTPWIQKGLRQETDPRSWRAFKDRGEGRGGWLERDF